MNTPHVEIADDTVSYLLHGCSANVPEERYAETGMRLMGELWPAIKQQNIKTKGVNHWVYLPDGTMFVGVELLNDGSTPQELQPLSFTLQRRLVHLHRGAYEKLPAKWATLKEVIVERGEAMQGPALEVYGHHSDDPELQETTIVIGLRDRG